MVILIADKQILKVIPMSGLTFPVFMLLKKNTYFHSKLSVYLLTWHVVYVCFRF